MFQLSLSDNEEGVDKENLNTLNIAEYLPDSFQVKTLSNTFSATQRLVRVILTKVCFRQAKMTKTPTKLAQ